MLNRQKSILEMLRLAGRPVTKLELVKWAFVISRETPTRGGDSFYEFLPYHFGPYSFSMQRDLEAMVEAGAVTATEKAWIHGPDANETTLPPSIRSDVRRIVERFRDRSADEVIDEVYQRYPAYTVNSRRARLAERQTAPPAVHTAGYEGLQIDGFLDLLIQHGITRLLDVRNNPVARRYGFHKSTLSRLCGLLGIEYAHLPELGIVSEQRQHLDTDADYSRLFDSYEVTTLVRESAALDRVGAWMLEKPSVLVCMEAEACRCHRSRLGTEVARRTGLNIIHLAPPHEPFARSSSGPHPRPGHGDDLPAPI